VSHFPRTSGGLVSLTIAGRATPRSAQKVADDAPEALASLPEEDVATLLSNLREGRPRAISSVTRGLVWHRILAWSYRRLP
jgi:hypothetical protein